MQKSLALNINLIGNKGVLWFYTTEKISIPHLKILIYIFQNKIVDENLHLNCKNNKRGKKIFKYLEKLLAYSNHWDITVIDSKKNIVYIKSSFYIKEHSFARIYQKPGIGL